MSKKNISAVPPTCYPRRFAPQKPLTRRSSPGNTPDENVSPYCSPLRIDGFNFQPTEIQEEITRSKKKKPYTKFIKKIFRIGNELYTQYSRIFGRI